MKKIIHVLASALVLLSCSKDNTSNDQGPVITTSSPADNQVFSAGQTITVAAAFTDLDLIRKTQIHVVNKASGSDQLHVEGQPNAVSATLSGSFVAAAGVTYKIEVEAIDIAGNESKAELTVAGK